MSKFEINQFYQLHIRKVSKLARKLDKLELYSMIGSIKTLSFRLLRYCFMLLKILQDRNYAYNSTKFAFIILNAFHLKLERPNLDIKMQMEMKCHGVLRKK